ncbi:MAG: AI-2E family transporter [Oscillospiraceae bacterium]|nr:AI-2E family transporter [Oscillospiraceae bacterium]
MNISKTSCIRILLTVLIAFVCIRYWAAAETAVRIAVSAASPLLVGAVIAYIVNILMSFYERKLSVSPKLRRPVCMLLAFLTLALVVVLLFSMIIPELINCLQLILEKLPGALRTAYMWMDENFNISAYLTDQNIISTLENLNIQDTVKKIFNVLMSGVGGAMGSIVTGVSSIVSAVATAFIALVFSVYLLLGKESLGGQITRLLKTYLGEDVQNKLLYVSRVADTSFHNFIVGQCLDAVILGALCILGMTIFRFPYAMMIGCLVGFTALIPIAGAYIGAAVGAFMIFTVNPLQALLFVVFLVVLQQLEGNLIYPKIVGASIGLPGIYVLAAITVGGGVMGIPGMLLGVPVTAALYRLVKDNLTAKEAVAVIPVTTDETE